MDFLKHSELILDFIKFKLNVYEPTIHNIEISKESDNLNISYSWYNNRGERGIETMKIDKLELSIFVYDKLIEKTNNKQNNYFKYRK